MRSGYVRDSVRDNGVFLALRMAEPCLFSRSFGFCITPTPSTRSAIVPSTSTSASLFMRQVKEGARPSGGCRTSTMPTATCRELRARRFVTTGYMLSPLNGRLPKFEHGSPDSISISSILARTTAGPDRLFPARIPGALALPGLHLPSSLLLAFLPSAAIEASEHP